jgi:uncharacterized membrane protein
MIHEILEWLTIAIDGIGVVVMLIGFVLAMWRFPPTLFKPSAVAIGEVQVIRCSLGTYLVFALELMIVSDLIHSVVSRTLEDLYFLGAIVVVRTVISYFLNKEIESLQEHSSARPMQGTTS